MTSTQIHPTAEEIRARVIEFNDRICEGIENGVIADVMREIRMDLVCKL
jgi:hypothetical protein